MKHLAIIMDGNKRWAERENTSLELAYREGSKRVEEIISKVKELKIPFLTLYAFSQENWSRPQPEIDLLMSLLEEALIKLGERVSNEKLKISFIGEKSSLPIKIQKIIQDLTILSKEKEILHLRIALSYGSQQEIIKAAYETPSEESLEAYSQLFLNHLNPDSIPEPDFLIRTSGEKRLSNFLLFELAYSELYFTETLWPDFNGDCLAIALEDFNKRNRRFGNVRPIGRSKGDPERSEGQ
jgi:undecaprenyl diphosphate synthase